MSFSSELKAALCQKSSSDCCTRAQLYGMLLFSRTFSPRDISLSSESKETVEVFARLVRRVLDCYVSISERGETRKRYHGEVLGDAERKRALNAYAKLYQNEFSTVRMETLAKDCCKAAFLRGVFLACGTVSDPEKQYRLEFVVHTNTLAVDLYGLLYRRGLSPYLSARGKYVVVYIKKREDISDFLTAIEAPHYALELLGVTVVKDIRNNENRRNNFETANIAKTSQAAVLQCEAIKILKKQGRFAALPHELSDVAELRIENPDASLSVLLSLLEEKGETLTRSGLNHRLNKLIALSKE